jgi:hypothetical protein
MRAVPEIPESRFIVFAFKRRFVPACASLNRGFRGLHACAFVLQLANFYKYKRIITQPTESNASHRGVVILCVWICITACKLFTNTKASSLEQQRATHRIAVWSSYACWFVLQPVPEIPEISESRFIVFALKRRFVPACASLNRGFRGLITAFKLFTNTKASSLDQPNATHRSKRKGRVKGRALNPRFSRPLFGQKTGFRARVNHALLSVG